jgi:enoyl-[acyl-carrier protein] reductase I
VLHQIAQSLGGLLNQWQRMVARLPFTYQTEKLKGRVEKCAEICNSSIVIPCDVSSDEQINETFDELKKSWDSFDILIHSVAFA